MPPIQLVRAFQIKIFNCNIITPQVELKKVSLNVVTMAIARLEVFLSVARL